MRAPRVVLLCGASILLVLAGAAGLPGPARPDPAAQALFAKVVEGLGGTSKIAAVRDVRIRAKARIKTPQGEMDVTLTQVNVFPDRQQQEIEGPFGRVTTVFTPGEAFTADASGVQDLPAAARHEQARELARSPLMLARRASDPNLSLSVAGRERIGDFEAAVLDIVFQGARTRWLVDPTTGWILQTSFVAPGEAGLTDKRTTEYSDFRSVDGMTFAFRQEAALNGEKQQWITVETIEINTNPDPKLFQKPASKTSPRPADPTPLPAAP